MNPFLTLISFLLIIGLIRYVASKLGKRIKYPDATDNWLDHAEDNPEETLGVGAFNSYVPLSQPDEIMHQLLMQNEVSVDYGKPRIKKLSAVISTLKKRGIKIETVKKNMKTVAYRLVD